MSPEVTRLRDHAYSSFTEKLLARDIQPDQFLSQRELVELTGIPLGPIREMIPRLEADGLIRTSPKRGLQVLTININLIRDAFQLRRIIETEAIAEFCNKADRSELEDLLSAHEAILKKAGRTKVNTELLEHAQRIDWGFHDRVIDHLNNRIISDIYRVNSIKIRLIRNQETRILPELVSSVMKEHIDIIHALQARDCQAAVKAVQSHVDSAKRRALDV